MKSTAASLREGFVSTANEALDAGMFWRGNLTQAVRKKDFRGTFWGVLGVSLALFFYVWQHMQVVKLSYEVGQLKEQKQQLTNEYYYLKYKMYDVNGLPQVEKVAREQLGMVTPRADQIVILNDGSDILPRWLKAWTGFMSRMEGTRP